MIRCTAHAEYGYAEVTLDGKVDRESLDSALSELEPLMEEHGKLGLLKHVVSCGGIEPSALWRDLEFAFQHLKNVGPVAVVSDKKWVEVWTKIASPLWPSPVKFFEEDELDAARAWLIGKMAKRMSGARTPSPEGPRSS